MIENKVLQIIKENPDAADDDMLLISLIWEDKWDYDQGLYYNLKRMTHAETITRARRKLHEQGKIQYSPNALKRRTQRFKQYRDENSAGNIHAIKKNIETVNIVKDCQQNAATKLKEANENKIAESLFSQTSLPLEENHV